VAEAWPVAEAQPAAPVVVALPTSSAVETRPASTVGETFPEVEVAAPQHEPAARSRSRRRRLPRRRRSPPSPEAPRRRRWRFPTTMPRRPGGISGEAYPHQPSSLRRGHLSGGGMVMWWPGARGMALRPLHPTSAPLARATWRRAQGRGKSTLVRHPPSSPTPKRSSSCARSCAATALRSTER
jgi:hypothetical protein